MVKDSNGQALAYMYFEKETRHRYRRSELLTRDEAQSGEAIFAKLPEMLKRSDSNAGAGGGIPLRRSLLFVLRVTAAYTA